MGIDSVWDWLVGLLDGWMGLVLVGNGLCFAYPFKMDYASRTHPMEVVYVYISIGGLLLNYSLERAPAPQKRVGA